MIILKTIIGKIDNLFRGGDGCIRESNLSNLYISKNFQLSNLETLIFLKNQSFNFI